MRNTSMIATTTTVLNEVHVEPLPIESIRALIDPRASARLDRDIARARILLDGRVVWNINSTAAGGGVAEMLRSLVGYARGAGVDVRWLVLHGNDAFFRVTKRLHNFLHGDGGDEGILGDDEERVYTATIDRNVDELWDVIRPGDVVILHDPQTAGLVRPMRAMGAIVVWRCHVGAEFVNEYIVRAWEFLKPFIESAGAFIFSHRAYVPPGLKSDFVQVIAPSIDPLSPKNDYLTPGESRSVLQYVGLIAGERPKVVPSFHRLDGSFGRVEHRCDVLSDGPLPNFETPVIVQVSRWDHLKDPLGVMRGFADHVATHSEAQLILAGPTVHSVADDPEGLQVLNEVKQAWRTLPSLARGRVHLACLPMADAEENATIVNALQRHAAVVVQKSIQEGFGLTVAEAMWKARPVVASAIGGIRDQIEDGTSGLLLSDPRDLAAFGDLLRHVLLNPEWAANMGLQARQRVQEHFLVNRQLGQDLRLLERLLD
jgi:trehalose synthase